MGLCRRSRLWPLGHVPVAAHFDGIEHRLAEARRGKQHAAAVHGLRDIGIAIEGEPPKLFATGGIMGHDLVAAQADELRLAVNLDLQRRALGDGTSNLPVLRASLMC